MSMWTEHEIIFLKDNGWELAGNQFIKNLENDGSVYETITRTNSEYVITFHEKDDLFYWYPITETIPISKSHLLVEFINKH